MSIRIFEGELHAQLYAQFRPTAPKRVLDTVFDYLAERVDASHWQIAVDVGCGSGQCTNAFAPHFRRVFGFDVSPAQISEAINCGHPENVEFGVSPAESLPLISSNSAQLLSASTAAHWFDLERFFGEASRVLAVNGVLALFSFSVPKPIDPLNANNERVNNFMDDCFVDPILAPYINPNTRIWQNRYLDIRFPSNFDYVYKDGITVTVNTSAQQLIGYIKSWSYYQSFASSDKKGAQEFILNAENKLKHILGVEDLSRKDMLCSYDYFIAMGRKFK